MPSKPETVVVLAANLTDHVVYLKDGRSWPITMWLDDCGEPIEAMDEAAFFTAGRDGEGFILQRLADYQIMVMQ